MGIKLDMRDHTAIATTSAGKSHFVALDGLRGMAALLVVVYHMHQLLGTADIAPHGRVAVDFFFMLSGFVIACAYEERIRSARLATPRLILSRAIRLLPMSTAGLALGVCYYLVSGEATNGNASEFIGHSLAGLLLLPNPLANPFLNNILPLNGPSWSLFFELYAGTALTLLLPRLGNRWVVAIALLTGITFAASVFATDVFNLGYSSDTFLHGFFRFIFLFASGWLLWRYRVDLWAPKVPGWFVGASLAALMMFPTLSHANYVDLVIAFAACPIVIALGSASQVSERGLRISEWSGRLSYPLYAIHFPIIMFADLWLPNSQLRWMTLPVSIVASIAALLLYDEPLRRLLDAWARRSKQR